MIEGDCYAFPLQNRILFRHKNMMKSPMTTSLWGALITSWILILSCDSACPGLCTQCDLDSFGDIVNVTCQNSGDFKLIPRNIRNIVFQNGNLYLGILKDFYFLGIYELESVKISNYQLGELWGAVFLNCSDIKLMDFSNNHIHSISYENFEGPSALEILNLQKNEITRLPDDVFKGLEKLTELNLADNQITELTKLALNGLVNLRKFDISRNQITSVDVNSFRSLTNVQEIYLISNQLALVGEDLFNGLARLRELKLSHNHIASILSNAVNGTGIITLDLSWNNLTHVPSQTLRQVSGTNTSVNLQRNRIKVLCANSLSNVTLKILDLANNGMTRVDRHAMEHCRIKYINMAVNSITTLPETMKDYLTSRISPAILLTRNPLICDCGLRWFGEFLSSHHWRRTPQCSSPPIYARQSVVDYFLQSNDSCITTTQTITTSAILTSHLKTPTATSTSQKSNSTKNIIFSTKPKHTTPAISTMKPTIINLLTPQKSSFSPHAYTSDFKSLSDKHTSPVNGNITRGNTHKATSSQSTFSLSSHSKTAIFHGNTWVPTAFTTNKLKNMSIQSTDQTTATTNPYFAPSKTTANRNQTTMNINPITTNLFKVTTQPIISLSKFDQPKTKMTSSTTMPPSPKTDYQATPTASPTTDYQASPTAEPKTDIQQLSSHQTHTRNITPHTRQQLSSLHTNTGNITPHTRQQQSSLQTYTTMPRSSESTGVKTSSNVTSNFDNTTKLPTTNTITETPKTNTTGHTSTITKNQETSNLQSTVTIATHPDTSESSNNTFLSIGLPILIILLVIIAFLLFLLLFKRRSEPEEKEDLWPYYKYNRDTLGPANTVFKYKRCKK